MPWVERVTDDFNRVNQLLDTGLWFGGSPPCKIMSQKATGSAFGQLSRSHCVGVPLLPDQYAEGDLNSLGAVAAYGGLTLRGPGGSDRGYGFIWSYSTLQLTIFRFVGGVLSALTGGPSTWPHPTNVNGRMRAEAVGQTLSMYWNGVLIGSQTDTFYNDWGAGIMDSTASNEWAVDNFSAGEWVAPSPWITGKHNLGPRSKMRFR
jgi:hypothetical protein